MTFFIDNFVNNDIALVSQWLIGHSADMSDRSENMLIPSPNRARMSPSDRQAQLLNVAVTVYSRMGVERAGHGDVAKLAGVSTATVFNYFPTREALTTAVLSEVERVTEAIFENATPGVTGRAQLLPLISALSDTVTRRPDIVKVFLNWSVSFGDDVRPAYLTFQDRLLTTIHTQLTGEPRAGVKGERAQARIILGAATTFAMMTLDNSPPETTAKFIERLSRILD